MKDMSETLFSLIDRATESYQRTDEKFGNWHRWGLVNREKLLSDLKNLFHSHTIRRIETYSDGTGLIAQRVFYNDNTAEDFPKLDKDDNEKFIGHYVECEQCAPEYRHCLKCERHRENNEAQAS